MCQESSLVGSSTLFIFKYWIEKLKKNIFSKECVAEEIDYLGPKIAGQYFSFLFLVIITLSHIHTHLSLFT